MGRFIIKHINNNKPQKKAYVKEEKNNKTIKNNVMTTSEKVQMAKDVLNGSEQQAQPFKRVKRDKGLIERTESSKTILTEDNKELLKD